MGIAFDMADGFIQEGVEPDQVFKGDEGGEFCDKYLFLRKEARG